MLYFMIESQINPDFFNDFLKGIYRSVATIVEMTALIEVDATFQASVISAAGFPRIISL